MVNIFEEYAFDKGALSVADLNFFEEMTDEAIGESDQQADLQFVRRLSDDRRLIIRQLLAEVSRLRSDYKWEW